MARSKGWHSQRSIILHKKRDDLSVSLPLSPAMNGLQHYSIRLSVGYLQIPTLIPRSMDSSPDTFVSRKAILEVLDVSGWPYFTSP